MSKDAEIEVDRLIQEFGSNSYREAVRRTVEATRNGEAWVAEIFSEAAIELMRLGYHKNETKVAN